MKAPIAQIRKTQASGMTNWEYLVNYIRKNCHVTDVRGMKQHLRESGRAFAKFIAAYRQLMPSSRLTFDGHRLLETRPDGAVLHVCAVASYVGNKATVTIEPSTSTCKINGIEQPRVWAIRVTNPNGSGLIYNTTAVVKN